MRSENKNFYHKPANQYLNELMRWQTEFENLEEIEETLNSFILSDHQKLYTTSKWVPRKYLPDTDRCAIVCNFDKCFFRYYV